jgi:4'-phosphopantetheinyl transferase
MHTRKLQLWFAYPGDLADECVAAACAGLLSPEEQLRFGSRSHCLSSLTGRALARIALSHTHPLPPGGWQFVANAHGKPSALPECGLRFNLSNAVDLVACLVAVGAEVGVDIEPHTRAAQILRIAPKVFSPVEQAQLSVLPSVARADRALSLWTLKEAYTKARGLGLLLPLDKISFCFGYEAGVHMELEPEIADDPARWTFCLLNHAGHRVALMMEQGYATGLTMLEVRPPLAAPSLVHSAALGWFPWN